MVLRRWGRPRSSAGRPPRACPFGGNDFGVSGRQYEAGLTWYVNGHANKLALAATLWQAEEGDADATIIRLQHQFTF